jgi:hypothetical protein
MKPEVIDLKMFVIKELMQIAHGCPDQRLRLQALELLYKLIDALEKE